MNKRKILKFLVVISLFAVLMLGCSEKKEVAKKSDNTDSVIVSAQKYAESKDYNKAIDEYKKAIELSPDDIDIRLKLSDVYFQIQQYSKSEKVLISALKVNSDRLDIYDRLIKVYDKMGYDVEYVFEACKGNNVNISNKTKEKLIDKFDISESTSKKQKNDDFKQEKFITIQGTSIRNAPRLHGSQVIKTVGQGAKLLKLNNERIYDIDPDGDSRYWYNVKTEDGVAGWVSEKALNGTNKDGKKEKSTNFASDYNNTEGSRTYFTSQDTNVRKTPNYYEDESNILKAIPRGERLIELNPTWVYEQDKITGRDRCWINVQLSNGETGWVSKRALDMTNR